MTTEDDWAFDTAPAPKWRVVLQNCRNNKTSTYIVSAWSADQAAQDCINARKVPSDYGWISAVPA